MIQIEMIVPDKGTYTCEFDIKRSMRDLLMPGWKKRWLRLSCAGWPDILGVHVYFKNTNSNITELKIRISNGSVNKNGSGFCGKVYFKSLKIRNTDKKNFVIVPRADETNTGTEWTIAALLPDNDNHVMLPRWILEREFCLCTPGFEQQAAALLIRDNVVIPTTVTNYGPCNVTMPQVNRGMYKTIYTQAVNATRSSLQSGGNLYVAGLVDLQTANIGPWHPHGNREAYAFGGLDINPYTGFGQVKEMVHLSSLLHIANIDRMPIACYDIVTGDPIKSTDWTNRDLIHAVLTKGEPGYQTNLELLAFVVGDYNTYKYPVFNPGNTCSYEGILRTYSAHDVAHLRRGSIHGEVLWHYETNPMVGDDFLMMFEYVRQSDFSDRPDELLWAPPHNPGQYIPRSLTRLYAITNSHNGCNVDRAFGWGMYHGALAELVKDGYASGWLDKAIKVYAKGSDLTHGIVQREYHQPFMPSNVEGTQSFHTAILALGACAAIRQTNSVHAAEAKAALIRLCTKFYGGDNLQMIPYTYNNSLRGPPHWVWTHENQIKINPLSNAKASIDGDTAHTLAVFAEVHRLTGDKIVLRNSLKHWLPTASLQSRYAFLQNGVTLLDRAQTAGYETVVKSFI